MSDKGSLPIESRLAKNQFHGTLINSHLASSNYQSFTCLWLDQTVNSTEDNRETQQELRQVLNSIQTFDKSDVCDIYIKQATEEKIILIVSGSLGRVVIPRLHMLPQLSICYVFCRDKQANEEWASKYPKIKGVFVQRSELLAALVEDSSPSTKIPLGATISVIRHGTTSLQAHNAIFMWFQLFIEVLLRMHHKSIDRKELIDICKKNFKGNKQEMDIIEEFEKNYRADNAIWWYTREACFYRMMNKALRVQDYDTLFALRFFITDIAKQLKNEHEKFIRTSTNREKIYVYRGQASDPAELELMKKSVGEFLSMNAFLSTSRNRGTAVRFARKVSLTGNNHRILFEIEIDPRMKTTAFADISTMSYCRKEDEVLIMLGALFRIESVTEDRENRIWVTRVSLASDDDYQLKETFAYMKQKIGDDTNLDSLGRILIEMGQHRQAEKCYERMLQELTVGVGDAHVGLGLAQLQANEYEQGLEHFEKSLHIRKQMLEKDHVKVGDCLHHIGGVHGKKGNYEEALVTLTKAAEILENTHPTDPVALARTYHKTAITYQQLEKPDLSLEYYEKALKVQQTNLPSDHPDIAGTFNSLGSFHENSKNYIKALNYYEKALDIYQRTLPPTHEDIIQTQNNIKHLKDNVRTSLRLSKK